MNVPLVSMTAMKMQHVLTLLAASVVLVTMDLQEMAPAAAVREYRAQTKYLHTQVVSEQ